jgi:hypothetical protein
MKNPALLQQKEHDASYHDALHVPPSFKRIPLCADIKPASLGIEVLYYCMPDIIWRNFKFVPFSYGFKRLEQIESRVSVASDGSTTIRVVPKGPVYFCDVNTIIDREKRVDATHDILRVAQTVPQELVLDPSRSSWRSLGGALVPLVSLHTCCHHRMLLSVLLMISLNQSLVVDPLLLFDCCCHGRLNMSRTEKEQKKCRE